MVKLVIFDVDGLILDTESIWQEAWQDVGMKHNLDFLGTRTFLKCVGLSGKVAEANVIEDLKDVPIDPLAIMEECRCLGKKYLKERLRLKPGVVRLLQEIKKQGIPVAIATTTTKDLTYERLTQVGILSYFDYLLCGDEVVHRKPDPEIYLKVLSHFNCEGKDALVLEDSIVGVEAGYQAGAHVIMVPDLIPAGLRQQEICDSIVSSLEDVIPFISASAN